MALDGGEWSASCPGQVIHGDRDPGTHTIGSWAGPRASLDATVKRKIFAPPETHPACSQITILTELSWFLPPDILTKMLPCMLHVLPISLFTKTLPNEV